MNSLSSLNEILESDIEEVNKGENAERHKEVTEEEKQ